MTKIRTSKTASKIDRAKSAAEAPGRASQARPADPEMASPAPAALSTAGKPKSKQQQLAALVVRDEGATPEQTIRATPSTSDGWRLPAREIEPLVRSRLMALLNDPVDVISCDGSKELSPDELKMILERGKAAADTLASQRSADTLLVRELVAEVRLGAEHVSIDVASGALADLLGTEFSSEPVTFHLAARLKRRGHVMKLVTPIGTAASPDIDRTLVKAIVQGRRWWQELLADTNITLRDIARRENVSGPYVVRLVRLAFLSPDMIGRIADGTLPAHLTVKRLTAPDAIAARWDRQLA